MRILRVRHGFQADHSSSSYLFYAADKPVSPEGQKLAHQYSSRAEVDQRSVKYVKWGGGDLAFGAHEKLLGKHYDVMVSESYDWWTLKIAVPKTAEMKRLLQPFHDARGYDDLGVDVEQYGSRLVAEVYCAIDAGSLPDTAWDDTFEYLAKKLVKIRQEIMQGNVSFLQAVASYYGAEEEDEEDEEAEAEGTAEAVDWMRADLTKPQLAEACRARGIPCRKTWTKAQLREALGKAVAPPAKPPAKPRAKAKLPKLSAAAKAVVGVLTAP